METHMFPWPEGARFARVRVNEDGIPRDADIRLVPPTEPGALAVLHVWHRAPQDAPPLTFSIEVSDDGNTWVSSRGPRSTQAA